MFFNPCLKQLVFWPQPEASQVALVVKKPPANAGGVRDVSSKEMATHSSILA